MSTFNPHGCRQCGEKLDAYPPDDIYTIAMMEKCKICTRKIRYKEITFTCENCDLPNKLYFHSNEPHSSMEVMNARRNERFRTRAY